jgi:hypothetical protein
VLGTIPLAVIARMTRSSMLEVLREDYIRTARPKACRRRVVFVHGLRNALIPVLTVVGLQVGTLLAGAVLTETIFSWPGIGKWLIEAIGARDYPVVQNGILLIACLVILVNFVVDILYGLPTHASVISAEVMTMTTPTQAPAVDQSLLYPSPYKEFWQAFSKNKGAVAGLLFMLLVCSARSSPRGSRRITPASNTATSC